MQCREARQKHEGIEGKQQASNWYECEKYRKINQKHDGFGSNERDCKDTSGSDLEKRQTNISEQKPDREASYGMYDGTTKQDYTIVSDLARTVAEISRLIFLFTSLPDIDVHHRFSMPATIKSSLSYLLSENKGDEHDFLYDAPSFLLCLTRSATLFQANLKLLKWAAANRFAFSDLHSNIKFWFKKRSQHST